MNCTYSYSRAITALLKAFFSAAGPVVTGHYEEGSLAGTLISTPIFKVTNNIVTIQLFYYSSKGGISDKTLKTLGILITILSLRSDNVLANSSVVIAKHKIAENITVSLQMVRLYQPYLNASILAQYIAINASKYGFYRMMTTLLNAVPYAMVSDNHYNVKTVLPIVPSCTTGLKVQLSGLLTSQRNPARKTVYTASAGTFSSPTNTNNATMNTIDYAYSTSKSIEGSFNVKV